MDEVLVRNLIEAAALAIIGLLAFGLRQLVVIVILYLRQKLGLERLLEMKEIAQTVVRTLQQMPVFEALDPAQKKEMALVALVQYAEGHNIPVDRPLIDKLIEEAVQIMKAELPKIEGELLDTFTPAASAPVS